MQNIQVNADFPNGATRPSKEEELSNTHMISRKEGCLVNKAHVTGHYKRKRNGHGADCFPGYLAG